MRWHRNNFERRVRRIRRGLGLAELLIALAISATLLVAAGIAIDASFKSYAINQEYSDLAHRSRLAMYRITTMIRQTKEHAPHGSTAASDFATGKTVTDTGIDMFDLNDRHVTYRYDSSTKQVIVTVAGVDHVLLEGVEAFTISMEPMRSADSIKTGGSWDLLKRASITLTLRSSDDTALKGEGHGRQTLTLNSSVMPRRNTW